MEWCIYNYLYYSKKAKKHLLYSSLSNMFVELNDEAYQAILRIKSNPDSTEAKAEQFRFLFDKRFIVESNKVEQNKLILTTLSQRYQTNSMSLTIAPTNGCNFACPYCYESNKKFNHMSKRVEDGLIDFIKRGDTIRSLNVTWYGGEPTTALKTLKSLSFRMQEAVKYYNAHMITNGYNLDKIVDDIENLKITRIQITLDGTKPSHDKTRCLIGGQGSFDKIISNIKLLLSKNDKVRIAIRMNISNDNKDEYEKLYHYLETTFNKSKQIHLYPAFVEDYTGCQLGNCFENNKEKAKFLKKLFYEKGISSYSLYPERCGKGCMRQTMNAFVVGPMGELYKCWHHLGVKEKIVGNIFEKNVITNFTELTKMMIDNDVLFDTKCKKCVLFPSCNGGCADIKDNNNNVCALAKSMLSDFLDVRYVQNNNNLVSLQN